MDLELDTIRRARAGEPQAQAAFLRASLGPVRGLIRKLNGPHDLDDRVQEVLAHLLKVLPQFDLHGPARIGTWVYTVTYRALLMHKRKRHLSLVPLDEAKAVADARPRVDAELERRQLRARIDAAVDELDEAQRRVFVMAQLHELPLQEIADAEGVPLGTVKSRLHRAKAELVVRLGGLLDENLKGGGHAANG